MLKISKSYLCESTVVIIRINHAMLKYICYFVSDGKSPELIFICEACFSFFKRRYSPQNFYFKELRKCLLEKYVKKAQGILVPTTSLKMML